MTKRIVGVVLVWSLVTCVAAQDEAQTLQTVRDGIAAREQQLQSVTGTAIVRTFYTEHHWKYLAKLFRDTLGDKAGFEFASGPKPDRDMLLFAFTCARDKWRVEQQALHPGANSWFTPKDSGRALNEMARFYAVQTCDGQNVFRFSRDGKFPGTSITAFTGQSPPFLYEPLSRWLGLGFTSAVFSEELTATIDKLGFKLATVERLDDGIVYLEIGGRDQEAIAEVRYWVDTTAGFALRRYERLTTADGFPQSGSRDVMVWGDFLPPEGDGPWLPRTCTHQSFGYVPDCDAPHTYTEIVQLTVTGVNDEISLQTVPWLPPGALVRVDESVEDPQLRALSEPSMRLWMEADSFAKESAPIPDTEYSQPIGPELLEALHAKYDLD